MDDKGKGSILNPQGEANLSTRLPNLTKPFEVHCDASGSCLGAVLLQEGHAIAYESRRLHLKEEILGIYEKDLLIVLHALDSWKH